MLVITDIKIKEMDDTEFFSSMILCMNISLMPFKILCI